MFLFYTVNDNTFINSLYINYSRGRAHFTFLLRTYLSLYSCLNY